MALNTFYGFDTDGEEIHRACELRRRFNAEAALTLDELKQMTGD
jgi:hypothetical protein